MNRSKLDHSLCWHLLEKTIFDPGALVTRIKDKKVRSLCQIIDIVSEDYSFRLILAKSKSTVVQIQSISEHQVKFS